MKELVIIKTDKMGFDSFSTETTYFTFDGCEGRFIKTSIGDKVEYEAGFMTGYAAWNTVSDTANTCFGNTSMDLSEFMNAFHNKFGIDIPTV